MGKSKNNPAARGKSENKTYEGKIVVPVKYVGNNVGHGTYIAAQYQDNNKLILDKNGRPVPWDSL